MIPLIIFCTDAWGWVWGYLHCAAIVLDNTGTMGRPLKFKTPEDFDMMVDLYVAECKEEKQVLTIPDLALYLGFCDRHSLYDYQAKEQFTSSVKRARTIVEAATARLSMSGGAGGGPIFILKNMGYTDRQQVTIDPVTVVISGKDALL